MSQNPSHGLQKCSIRRPNSKKNSSVKNETIVKYLKNVKSDSPDSLDECEDIKIISPDSSVKTSPKLLNIILNDSVNDKADFISPEKNTDVAKNLKWQLNKNNTQPKKPGRKKGISSTLKIIKDNVGCPEKKLKEIERKSKYFNKVKTVTPDSLSKSDKLISSNPMPTLSAQKLKKISLNDSTNDEADFVSPKKITLPQKNVKWQLIQKKSQPNRSAKRKGFSTTLKIIEDNLGGSEENADHLQMAIALSKSTYEAEYGKQLDSGNEEMPDINEILDMANVSSVKASFLDRFKCKSGKKVLSVEHRKKESLKQSSRNRSKYKYIRPILEIRTEEQRESIISSKISQILRCNLSEIKAQSDYVIYSKKLGELVCTGRVIFNEDSVYENSYFYVEALQLPKSKPNKGQFLKDWRKIPGRCCTPERKTKEIINSSSTVVKKDALEEDLNIFSNVLIDTRNESLLHTSTRQKKLKVSTLNEINLSRCVSPDIFDSDDEVFCKTGTLSEEYFNTKKDEHTLECKRESSLEYMDDGEELPEIISQNNFNRISEVIVISEDENDMDAQDHSTPDKYTYSSNSKHTNKVPDDQKDCKMSDFYNYPLPNYVKDKIYEVSSDLNKKRNSVSDSEFLGNGFLDHTEICNKINPNDRESNTVNDLLSDLPCETKGDGNEFVVGNECNFKSSVKSCPNRFDDTSPIKLDNLKFDLQEAPNTSSYTPYNENKRNHILVNNSLSSDYNQKNNSYSIRSHSPYKNGHQNNFSSVCNDVSTPDCHNIYDDFLDDPLPDHFGENEHFDTEELGEATKDTILNGSQNKEVDLGTVNKCVDNSKGNHEFIHLQTPPRRVTSIILDSPVYDSTDLNVTDYVSNLLNHPSCNFTNNSTDKVLGAKDENFDLCDDCPSSQSSQSSVIVDEELNYSSNYLSSIRKKVCQAKSIYDLDEVETDVRLTETKNPTKKESIRKEKKLNAVFNDCSQSSKNYSTPESVIIKTKNITPMPNYDTMNTPLINKELQKLGVKPLKRVRGAKLLKYIYESTHPLVDSKENRNTSESEEEDKRVIKKRKTSDPVCNLKTNPCSTDSAIDIVARGGMNGDKILQNERIEDLIFERKCSKRIPSCQVPLQIAWHNFITSNPAIKQNILLYEPLQLESLYLMLKEQGFKFHVQDLLTFLDKKCITIRTAQKQGKKHG